MFPCLDSVAKYLVHTRGAQSCKTDDFRQRKVQQRCPGIANFAYVSQRRINMSLVLANVPVRIRPRFKPCHLPKVHTSSGENKAEKTCALDWKMLIRIDRCLETSEKGSEDLVAVWKSRETPSRTRTLFVTEFPSP